MKAKTFSAGTMRHAIDMVKKELGEDALILETRRLPPSKNDPYRKNIFQVEAMPPEKPEPAEALQVAAGIPSGAAFDQTGWEVLKKELGSIRQMLYSMNCNDFFAELMNTHPGLFGIYAKLIRFGISEKRSRMILEKSFSDETEVLKTQSDYTRKVYKTMLSLLETTTPFYEKKSERPRAIAFAGPTGAGKTTTIAKLAARLLLEKKQKTGLISIDNYRIGAFDQLKAYASIIGIPCIPAFTKAEIVKALNSLGRMDYILVDTAGRSHLDKKRLIELKSLISVNSDIENHLVVSAATARMDMKEVTESFRILNPVGYIFTKIDETRRRGVIMDQVTEHSLPITFLTNGQEVPEDIIVGNRKKTLQLIMDPDA